MEKRSEFINIIWMAKLKKKRSPKEKSKKVTLIVEFIKGSVLKFMAEVELRVCVDELS